MGNVIESHGFDRTHFDAHCCRPAATNPTSLTSKICTCHPRRTHAPNCSTPTRIRGDLFTGRTWRKALLTIGDDAGISAVALADHAGHTEASMTQNTYMGRKRVRYRVAAAIDAAYAGREAGSILGESLEIAVPFRQPCHENGSGQKVDQPSGLSR
ncbi:hypothetical protein [Nocardia sp. BMG111209]|uniref:hypothetical protein n=1 Tax=Nocardia sp. BMG111209 TaxID=1160137 RepID=UPI0012DC725A|nr:hypothetical protein [Nocardia sp. BMG111209]